MGSMEKGNTKPCYKFYVEYKKELDEQSSGAREYDVTY